MALITFEGQEAWLASDDNRDNYFELFDEISEKFPRLFKMDTTFWNAELDPLVIIDFSQFDLKNSEILRNKLRKIGAKEVTEQYS